MKNQKVFKTDKGIIKVTNIDNKLVFELPTGMIGSHFIKFKKENKDELKKLK